MTIYILDNDPEKCAQALDDTSLDKMIRTIAQVLCSVHWFYLQSQKTRENEEWNSLSGYTYSQDNLPIQPKCGKEAEWSQWSRECVANYEYLRKLGTACDWELAYRHDFKLSKKYHDIFEWARDNVPDLPIKHTFYCREFKSHIGHDKFGRPLIELCQGQCEKITPLPLVMPRKYYQNNKISIQPNIYGFKDEIIMAYRSYYQTKLDEHLKKYGHYDFLCWTRREKPEWVRL